MNCKKARYLLPLMIGAELPQSKIQAMKAHLKKCARCQHEYDSYAVFHNKIKEWLAKDKKEWEEIEWQKVVRNAIREKPPEVLPLVPWPFRKAWAYALMAVFVIGLTFFLVKPSFIKEGMGPGTEVLAKEKSEQDVISMTMVSKETGLKIVWFFNKNFELEEKK
ncbi:MAG: zf-HC2 domain-containing protein [Candidatus Aminicenantes bacterium]|nr:MAG: zf-HC2 domain-containing protein [Candidatus Aminicenantes bacterium]